MRTTFADTVRADVINPIETLCSLLSEEGCYAEFAWFSGILQMLATPEDEASVLTAVIELSQCAFHCHTESVHVVVYSKDQTFVSNNCLR